MRARITAVAANEGGNTRMAAAAAVVAIVPTTVLYVAFYRYLAKGVLDSAFK